MRSSEAPSVYIIPNATERDRTIAPSAPPEEEEAHSVPRALDIEPLSQQIPRVHCVNQHDIQHDNPVMPPSTAVHLAPFANMQYASVSAPDVPSSTNIVIASKRSVSVPDKMRTTSKSFATKSKKQNKVKKASAVACLFGFVALILIIVGLVLDSLARGEMLTMVTINCGWNEYSIDLGDSSTDLTVSYDEACNSERHSFSSKSSETSWCDTKSTASNTFIFTIGSALCVLIGIVFDFCCKPESYACQKYPDCPGYNRVMYALSVLLAIIGVVVFSGDDMCLGDEFFSDEAGNGMSLGMSLICQIIAACFAAFAAMLAR